MFLACPTCPLVPTTRLTEYVSYDVDNNKITMTRLPPPPHHPEQQIARQLSEERHAENYDNSEGDFDTSDKDRKKIDCLIGTVILYMDIDLLGVTITNPKTHIF
jgi:hypothetical protein